MTTIHDFKRSSAATHNFGDVDYVFQPNASGHVTCDIEDEAAIERFLSIHGFCAYVAEQEDGVPPAAVIAPPAKSGRKGAKAAEKPAPIPVVEPYVLIDGESGASFDLRPLSDVELHEFATANGITVAETAAGDAIRDAIVLALKAE